jgi:hypothetical protein
MAGKLDLLETYLEQGFPIIPVNPGSKEPFHDWKRSKWTPSRWEKLLKKEPGINLALLLGEGYLALDIDQEDTSGLPSHWLQSALIRTPRPGWKVLYKGEKALPSFQIDEGLEFHAQGKFALWPPSYIEGKGFYEWVLGLENIAEVPFDLLREAKKRGKLPDQGLLRLLEEAQYLKADCIRQVLMRGLEPGKRDKGLFILAVLLRKEGYDFSYTQDFILRFFRAGIKDKKCFTERQAREKVKQAYYRDYQKMECQYILKELPWVYCRNCPFSKRRLEMGLEKGAFVLKVKEECKGDPYALAVAVELAIRNFPYPVNRSLIAESLGLHRKTVSEKVEDFQKRGWLPPEEEKEPLAL